jgi:muramidase (phage lysozyme)
MTKTYSSNSHLENLGNLRSNASGSPDDRGQTGLPPEAIALLNTISGTESVGDYNVIYRGDHFNSYADHPRVFVNIPGATDPKKKFSSAAGKYQFVTSTWERAKRALGLTDFSPASQDKAAWYTAQQAYARAYPGHDLLHDLREGGAENMTRIATALSSEWDSLPAGGDPLISNSDFASAYDANLSGAAGHPVPPVGIDEIGRNVPSFADRPLPFSGPLVDDAGNPIPAQGAVPSASVTAARAREVLGLGDAPAQRTVPPASVTAKKTDDMLLQMARERAEQAAAQPQRSVPPASVTAAKTDALLDMLSQRVEAVTGAPPVDNLPAPLTAPLPATVEPPKPHTRSAAATEPTPRLPVVPDAAQFGIRGLGAYNPSELFMDSTDIAPAPRTAAEILRTGIPHDPLDMIAPTGMAPANPNAWGIARNSSGSPDDRSSTPPVLPLYVPPANTFLPGAQRVNNGSQAGTVLLADPNYRPAVADELDGVSTDPASVATSNWLPDIIPQLPQAKPKQVAEVPPAPKPYGSSDPFSIFYSPATAAEVPVPKNTSGSPDDRSSIAPTFTTRKVTETVPNPDYNAWLLDQTKPQGDQLVTSSTGASISRSARDAMSAVGPNAYQAPIVHAAPVAPAPPKTITRTRTVTVPAARSTGGTRSVPRVTGGTVAPVVPPAPNNPVGGFLHWMTTPLWGPKSESGIGLGDLLAGLLGGGAANPRANAEGGAVSVPPAINISEAPASSPAAGLLAKNGGGLGENARVSFLPGSEQRWLTGY